jgi:hypothetical protein
MRQPVLYYPQNLYAEEKPVAVSGGIRERKWCIDICITVLFDMLVLTMIRILTAKTESLTNK